MCRHVLFRVRGFKGAGVMVMLLAGVMVPAAQAVDYPEFTLDVGSANDTDSAADIYLDIDHNDPEFPILVSLTDPNDHFRTISPGSTLPFKVKTSSLTFLSTNGVPFRDAVIEVDYVDTVDETHCSYDSRTSACRPFLSTLLDDDSDPDYELVPNWYALLGIGGLAKFEQQYQTDWPTSEQRDTAVAFLENCPFQTLRSIDGFFHFRIEFPLPSDNALWIDKIRLRFRPRQAFETDRTTDRENRGLEQFNYEETNPALDPGAFVAPYMLFARNNLEKIYPNTIPAVGELLDPATDTLEVFEIGGEKEPLTFALHALDDLVGVAAAISDLRDDKQGLVIPATEMDIRLVRAIDKRWSWWANDKYYGVQPWFLESAQVGGAEVAAGQTQQFWLTIPCPSAGGTYAGRITVTGEDHKGYVHVETIRVSLRVYDISLPAPAATPWLCYSSPYNYLYYHTTRTRMFFARSPDTAARSQVDHGLLPTLSLEATITCDDCDSNGIPSVEFSEMIDSNGYLDNFDALATLPDEIFAEVEDNSSVLWDALCGDVGEPGVRYDADCPAFDAMYAQVLNQYKTRLQQWGATPALSYGDEPGLGSTIESKRARRRYCNYRNRCAQDAGLRTWVTYHEACEAPLAGHTFTLADGQDPQERTIAISLEEVPDTEPWRTISFAIARDDDASQGPATVKTLLVNETEVWSGTTLDPSPQNVSVDISSYLTPGATNTVVLSIDGTQATEERLDVYFLEESWRTATWATDAGDDWSCAYYPDDGGYLSPMGLWLDVRVHALSEVTSEAIERTEQQQDDFAYYTTYLATQAVPLNNRFLQGLYASAVGAKYVFPWAYSATWGPQPWDDCEAWETFRLGALGPFACGGYQLVMPSWDDYVYDTIVFETLREGIEDSRLLARLDAELLGESSSLAESIRQWRDSLLGPSGPDREFHARYMVADVGVPDHAKLDCSRRVLTDLAGDPTDYAFFDRTRRRMIYSIIALTDGISPDCNTNGVPDGWEISEGYDPDCNTNGIPDDCDIAVGTSEDCNSNGIPDECDVDCNSNGVPDDCDITVGTSEDCNTNGIPDECDVADCDGWTWCSDCNTNGVMDYCDTAFDVDGDRVPDECECPGDCNCDGVVDFDDLDYFVEALRGEGAWRDYYQSHDPSGAPPPCPYQNNDANGDGSVDFDDIDPFVALIGLTCPVGACCESGDCDMSDDADACTTSGGVFHAGLTCFQIDCGP